MALTPTALCAPAWEGPREADETNEDTAHPKQCKYFISCVQERPHSCAKGQGRNVFTRGFHSHCPLTVLSSLALCPKSLSLSSPGFFSQRQSISFQLIFEKGLFLGFTQLTMKWFVGVGGKTKQNNLRCLQNGCWAFQRPEMHGPAVLFYAGSSSSIVPS